VSGNELSCKSKGDALWKQPKSTKLCIGGAWCPYGVSPMDLNKVEILQVLLSELTSQMQIQIKCFEDEKSWLSKKLIRLCFNMEDRKANVLEV
jgi:hypothetical protein